MNQIGVLVFVGLLNLAWLASVPAFGQTGQAQSTNPRIQVAVELVKQGRTAQQAHQYGQAVTHYQNAVNVLEEALGPEHPTVATSINNLVVLYESIGEYAKALPLAQRTLAIRQKSLSAEHPNVATSLDNLGVVYREMGEYEKALPLHERSLAIREKVFGPDHPIVATGLNNMAVSYRKMGEYAKALPLYQRSLAILERSPGSRLPNVGQSLNNLAQVYLALGEHAKAMPLMQRSVAIGEKVLGPDHPNVASTLNSLAHSYRRRGDYVRALPLYERSLAILEKAYGSEHPNVASSLNNLGQLHRAMGDHTAALPLLQRSLAISEKTRGSEHASVAYSLHGLAGLYWSMGEHAKARPLLERSLIIAGHSNDPELLWNAQYGLHSVLARQNQPALAIFYGKQAVNTIQSMRTQLSELDESFQRSFLRNKTYVYRALADLLIEQGRLAEAQHVLGMLKEEEFFDFLRRNETDDHRQRRIAFQPHEQPWHDRLNALTGRAGKAATERTDLERRVKLGLSDAEKARLAELNREREMLRTELQKFYAEVAQAFATAKGQGTNAPDAVAQLKATQQTLSSLGTGSVLVQYVLSENRLNVILTTSTTQIAKSTAIPEKDLNQKIEFFRVGLRNPSISALPMAQELYKLLIVPIEQELAAANARTLMLSLDGVLRYIPVSALHDGKQYLIERYDLALYTEVTKDNLSHRPGKDMSIAGLGLTRQIENFDPLPAVRAELNAIVRNGNQGLIKGVLHFDEQFNVVNIRQALQNKHALVHLASHFVFRPGNESTSFLLLGDGDRLTLSRIREEKLDFSHVDLVTLSACETGVGGGTNAQGEEVEGLGALVQKQGAKGVIATLWPVADESTGLLMQHFYRLREEKKISKADALRQAQLMLIKGQLAPGTSIAQRGLDSPASAAPKAAALYAHPYFWAPFILMGNWL